MLGKDSVLVFQDACKAEFVNADDGNNAFGRVLAHWDWLFFWWRAEIAGGTFILWLSKNILNLFICVWKKLIKPPQARFLTDDKHSAGLGILQQQYGLTWRAASLQIHLRSKAVWHTERNITRRGPTFSVHRAGTGPLQFYPLGCLSLSVINKANTYCSPPCFYLVSQRSEPDLCQDE